MRQLLVIGNWKMHGNVSFNQQFFAELLPIASTFIHSKLAICPPLLFVESAARVLTASNIALGAQNVCAQSSDEGAFTGEVSAKMLAELGVNYVLVGHSERREYYFESDKIVAQKFLCAKQCGLTPVLCVGENLQQRESGDALRFVSQQLISVIDVVGIEQFKQAVVAYEPIWAIGTGKTASPEQAQEMHAHIRSVIAQYDQQIAESIQLLYGGSVKANNAASLFAKIDIDGALVGGASLKASEFIAICKAAE